MSEQHPTDERTLADTGMDQTAASIDPVGRHEESGAPADRPGVDTDRRDEDGDDQDPRASGRDGGRGDAGGRRDRRVADLEQEGDVAADFLETLLDIADLDGDIDVDIDGDRAAVSIVDSEEGRVPRRLVGPDGRVLEALQELTRLAVQASTGERSRLMLDVAGFRADRRASLVSQAREAVDRAKTSGTVVEMEPMTAFERKVVHDEVLAQGLRSESHGTEPRRYVTVLPAD